MICAGPAWLAGVLAAVMIATAGYCAGRIVYARLRRRRTEPDLDAVHAAMGLAMAGMFVPRLDVLPDDGWGKGTWSAVFCAAAAWFAARAWLAARTGGRGQAAHHISHAVACAAMVYMLLAPISGAATAGSGAMGGIAGGAAAVRFPTLALALTVLLVGSAVITADRITLATSPCGPSGGHAHRPTGPTGEMTHSVVAGPVEVRGSVIAPRAATCCHIAMNIAMAYMLVVLR